MDDHKSKHNHVTSGQLTLFTIWIVAFLLYACKHLLKKGRLPGLIKFHSCAEESIAKNSQQPLPADVTIAVGTSDEEKKAEVTQNDSKPTGSLGIKAEKSSQSSKKAISSTASPPSPDELLKSTILFGAILFFFFSTDYIKLLPAGPRVFNRDVFYFLILLLLVVGGAFTIKATPDQMLNRDQTEEWKGWMQVLFVWYHYFAAGEIYNLIRVFIAAYVWMTGFGNFSFFWVKKDYSLWRFLKMQFRLNFLVTFLCIVTDNEYMLYYICAMHTYWFVSVYVFMRVLTSWNTCRYKMAAKFAAYFVFNFVTFEIDVVRDNIFKPLWFILQYHNDGYDVMHEWSFRAGLDHWACFLGMLCAYNYPACESLLIYLEAKSTTKPEIILKRFYRATLIVVAFICLAVWISVGLPLTKFKYNAIHPYISLLPILGYIILRNAFPFLRRFHIGLLGWLGKITLETYLSQLHIYLQSNAKELIVYIPGYPLLNFSLASFIYVPVSYLLFNLTTTFSAVMLPNDIRTIGRNVAITGGIFFALFISFKIMGFQ